MDGSAFSMDLRARILAAVDAGMSYRSMLGKAAERTVSGAVTLIGRLVDLFQPDECANYFSSCGCEPD